MAEKHDIYENPLCRRYAGREMQEIFSDDRKFSTWRRLWVALAESERELGLNITVDQIAELRAHVDDIDYAVADAREHEVRHDVMAHIYAYGKVCPNARAIIHLGATSCYVGDNTDVILQREALLRIRTLLLRAISALADFAERYADLPTLAYTHFQAAQPTTVGKRATLWMQDLMLDLEHLEFVLGGMKLLGCRGTTGTGASFLDLFGGDGEKVHALEKKIAEKLGFESAYAVSGQTYTRKADYFLLSVLSGIAQSAMKFSGDIRLLSHMKEFDEPFESGQVGSSAMAYKRNPMRSERITSLARYVITDTLNPALTAGTQWLERTLDDSANRRISIPEAFLATDGILSLYINVISGGTIYPNVVRKHLMEELPFMATENILMECVKRGGDRQTLHEAIRRHSVAAGKAVKQDGADNDLLDRIAADPVFGLTRGDIDAIIAAGRFTGLAEEQTRSYAAAVRAALAANPAWAAALAAPDDSKVTV
jgi:adenylosuccinate lyase